MKKFTRLLTLALVFALVAALFTVGASAAKTEPESDPNTLKPGSDKVIFIKDAPRDEKFEVIGELEGDGSGSDAANPFKPSDHEKFDPNAEKKKWDYMTAFYQATEVLAETGGTIVICGPVYFGEKECTDNGSSVRDTYTAEYKNNVIKFTSVYDGVDYRETAGAKITIATPAMLSFRGSTILENLTINTIGTGRALTFADYCTLVGDGIVCAPVDEAFEGVAGNYPSLAAGSRWERSKDENPTLLVKSGTYNRITAGQLGTAKTHGTENANTYLTIEGTTRVLGNIYGTCQGVAPFGGNVNITINGGTFEGDINGVGPTGLSNTDGIVTIRISGGDFKNAYSINQAAMNMTNNPPAKASIDFSRWKGDTLGLAYASALITDITEIKYPAGVTADVLAKAIENAPAETEPEETEAPETQATETQAAETEAPVTQAPETQAPSSDGEGESGNSSVIIIVAIAAVIVIAAVVVAIVLKKKKSAK